MRVVSLAAFCTICLAIALPTRPALGQTNDANQSTLSSTTSSMLSIGTTAGVGAAITVLSMNRMTRKQQRRQIVRAMLRDNRRALLQQLALGAGAQIDDLAKIFAQTTPTQRRIFAKIARHHPLLRALLRQDLRPTDARLDHLLASLDQALEPQGAEP